MNKTTTATSSIQTQQSSQPKTEMNLTWLPYKNLPGKIYRGSKPNDIKKGIEELKAKKISLVVVLLEDKPNYCKLVEEYRNSGLVVDHSPIVDFNVPDDYNKFANTVENIIQFTTGGKNVAVHCLSGRGRTGIVLAILCKILHQEEGAEAIKWVRQYVKNAVEFPIQIDYVYEYHHARFLPDIIKKVHFVILSSFFYVEHSDSLTKQQLKARDVKTIFMLQMENESNLYEHYITEGFKVINIDSITKTQDSVKIIKETTGYINKELDERHSIFVQSPEGSHLTELVIACLAVERFNQDEGLALDYAQEHTPGLCTDLEKMKILRLYTSRYGYKSSFCTIQ